MIKFLIILFISFYSMSAKIYIDNINVLNYPQIEANYYKFNDRNFILDSVFLFEETQAISNKQFQLISGNNINLNAYFMIDISSSMQKNRNQVNQVISNLINNLNEGDSLGLISFNQNCYINSNKTDDKSKLNIALSVLNYFGSSNLNELFFNSPISVDKIFNQGEDFILITNKQSAGDYKRIRDFCDDNNIRLHIIYLSDNENSIYQNMTNGLYLKSNKFKSDYILLSQYLNNQLKKEDYYKISWETTRCGNNVNGNIIQSPDYNYDFSYSLSEVLGKVIEILPNSYSQINYTLNNQIFIDFNIQALAQDIEIKSIKTSNDEFEIISDLNTINKGQTDNFQVTIIPTENKYYFTNIIISTHCDNYIIPIEIGEYEYTDKNVNLNIKNGFDFFRGDNIDFEFIGLSPSDVISLDYFQNSQWNNIITNYNKNTYNWEVPNVSYGNLDFRLSFKDINFKIFNLKELNFGNKNANLIKLSYDSKLAAIINTDNRLTIIDTQEGIDNGNYADNLLNFNLLSWSYNSQKINAIRNSTNTPIIFSLNGEPPIELSSPNETITSTAWNNLSNQIICGTDEGNLLLYNNLGDNQPFSEVINVSSDPINLLEYNPNENILVFASNNGLIEAINLNNNNILNIISLSDNLVNISWNKNGDSLFISDLNNIYIYRLSFSQGTYRFNQIKSILVPHIYDYAEFDFINKLIYLKNNKNIKILNLDLTILNEFNIDNKFNNVFDLKNNILLTNESNNLLNIRELNKYNEFDFKNDTIFKNKANIIEKNLNLKNLNFGSLCYQIPLDTNVNNFTTNLNRKELILDSVSITNNNDNKITVNLNNYTLTRNQSLSLNILVNTNEIGEFSHKITLHSKNDKFVFDLVYNVIFDKIEKIQKYYNLGNINYKNQDSYDLEILNNLSDEPVKIMEINQLNSNENLSYELIDSIIQPSSNFNLKINYKGDELGNQQLHLQVFAENACSPFDFIIFGETVTPNINPPEIHNLDTIICKSENYKQLLIKNIGNGKLHLNDIFTNNDLFIISTNSTEILPNQDLIIDFELKSDEVGYFSDTLNLVTNQIFNKTNLFKILIDAHKYESKLEVISNYTFSNPEKNKELFGEFIIKNIGNTKENIELNSIEKKNYFEIIDIDQTQLSENEQTIVKVKFNPATENILYEEKFEILNYCGESNTITFTVDLRDIKPFLSSLSFVDFGEYYCQTQIIDSTLIIQNLGGTELIINNIEILGEDKSNFELLNWNNNPILISSNSFTQLRLRYKPNKIQEDNAYIEITSNIDDNNGKTLITLLGLFRNTSLSFDKSEITFINVESNLTHSTTLRISNIGNIIEDLTFNFDNPIFQVSAISKSPLPLNDFIEITIDFLGGLPDQIFSGNLTIVAECNTYTIPVNAIVRGTNYFELASQDIIAKTGDIIDLPIYFRNPEDLVLETPFILETELVVDKNIIIPLGENSFIEDDKRIIPLQFTVNDLSNKVLDNIKIKVTLGNKDNSEITFRNSKIKDNSLYYFEVNTSTLQIDNICLEGGQRFIEGSNSIYINIPYPNPADQFIEFQYGLIEDAFTTLSIKDIFGRNVLTLIDNEVIAHSNTLKISTSNFATGQYFIHLSTPNNQFTRIFTIIR